MGFSPDAGEQEVLAVCRHLPAVAHIDDVAREGLVVDSAMSGRVVHALRVAHMSHRDAVGGGEHLESLIHVQLTAAAPVAEPEGSIAKGTNLHTQDAWAHGMHGPRGHLHEVARMHRHPQPVALADGIVGRSLP